MAGFDRSKLKATAATVIQQQEKDFSRGNRNLDFNAIEVGDNVLRIFPYHPDGGGNSFAVPKSVSFLEIKQPKRTEDKKGIIEGQFEVKRKPIFNSKVHGGLDKDLVECYMDFAKKVAIPNYVGEDKEQFTKIWKKITGDQNNKNEMGIKPQDTWAVYAAKADGKDAEGNWKWGKIGLTDLKKSVKDLMTAKAAELETPDPFSDPDEGIAVIVTRAKTAEKPSDWYKVRLDMQKVQGVAYPVPVSSPLTDNQLEEWSKMKPLQELYVNSFKRKDLEYQIEGLKRFDDKLAADGFPILVFQYDEFLDVIEEISNQVPEDGQDNSDNNQPQEQQAPPVIQPVKKVAPPVQQQQATVKLETPPPARRTLPPRQQQAVATVAAPVVQEEVQVHNEPAGPHIQNINERLANIRKRTGK